jgi:hypothetical protein
LLVCSNEPEPQNPSINNYTNASFNREINAGNINPHQFIANADYNAQLQYYPSLNDQVMMHTSQDANVHTSDNCPDPTFDSNDGCDISLNEQHSEDYDSEDDSNYVDDTSTEHPSDHNIDEEHSTRKKICHLCIETFQ